MRIVLLALLVAGCFAEPGLASSPTQCPASEAVEDGFLVHPTPWSPFEGHCLALSERDGARDLALRKVAGDSVYLPIDAPGEYYIHITVTRADDKYCADSIGVFEEHPGQGIVHVIAENTPVCA